MLTSGSKPPLEAEDVLKLFSLYLQEYGESLLTSSDHFMNVCEMVYQQTMTLSSKLHSPSSPQQTFENNHLTSSSSQKPLKPFHVTLKITPEFLRECGMDPFLWLDWETSYCNNGGMMITKKSDPSKKPHEGLIERSLIERWWERRRREFRECTEHQGKMAVKSPYAIDENPLLTLLSTIHFHHLLTKLRYEFMFGRNVAKTPNSKILKIKFKILRLLNARVKEFQRKQKEKKGFFSWIVEQIVDNEYISELTNNDFEKFIYIFRNLKVVQLETNKSKKKSTQANNIEDVEVDLTLFQSLKHLIIRACFTRLVYIKGKYLTSQNHENDTIFKTLNVEGITIMDSQFLRIEKNIFHDFADTLRVLNLVNVDEQLLCDIFDDDTRSLSNSNKEFNKDINYFSALEALHISNVWFKSGEIPKFLDGSFFHNILVNHLKVFIMKHTNLELSILDTLTRRENRNFVLSHLVILNLSNNNIHTVIGRREAKNGDGHNVTVNLPNLLEFNLGYNELESLDSLSGLMTPKLEIINLENNKLCNNIAEGLKLLTANTQNHLKYINLRNNQIRNWIEIKHLNYFTKLYHLEVFGNEEISTGTYFKTILAYFRKNIPMDTLFILDGESYSKKDIETVLGISQSSSDNSSYNGLSESEGSDADAEDDYIDVRKLVNKKESSEQAKKRKIKKEKSSPEKKKSKKKKKAQKRVLSEFSEFKKNDMSSALSSGSSGNTNSLNIVDFGGSSSISPQSQSLDTSLKMLKEDFPFLEERSNKVLEQLQQIRNDGGSKWLTLLNEMGYLDDQSQQQLLTPKRNSNELAKTSPYSKDKDELEQFMNKLNKNSSHLKAMDSLSNFLFGKLRKPGSSEDPQQHSSEDSSPATTPRSAGQPKTDFLSSLDMKRISRLGNKQIPVLEVHPIYGIANAPNFEKFGVANMQGLSFIKSRGSQYGSDALVSKNLKLEPRSDFLNVSLIVNQSIFVAGKQERDHTRGIASSESDSSERKARYQRRNRYMNIQQLKEEIQEATTNSNDIATAENASSTRETNMEITDEQINKFNSSRKRKKGVFLKAEIAVPEGSHSHMSLDPNRLASLSSGGSSGNDSSISPSSIEKKDDDTHVSSCTTLSVEKDIDNHTTSTKSTMTTTPSSNHRASMRDFKRRNTIKQNTEKKDKVHIPVPVSTVEKYLNDDDLLESLLNEDEDVVTKKRSESILRSRGRTFVKPSTTTHSSADANKIRASTAFEKPIIVESTPVDASSFTRKTRILSTTTEEEKKVLETLISSPEEDEVILPIEKKEETLQQKVQILEHVNNELIAPQKNVQASDEDFDSFDEEIESSFKENSILSAMNTNIGTLSSSNSITSEKSTLSSQQPPSLLTEPSSVDKMGQSSDSDFDTFSSDSDKENDKKTASTTTTTTTNTPLSVVNKSRSSPNSIPLITFPTSTENRKAKSKSIINIFAKKDKGVDAKLKDRYSLRMDSPVRELPAEEPEVLSTSVTDGIVEFGPITSSTTFASLKQQESTTTTDTSDFHTTLEEHSKHETQMMMTSNTISAAGKEELSSDFETSSDSDLGEQDPFKKNHPSEHAVLHTENDNSANATTTINTTLPTVTFTTRNVEESSTHHASKQDEDLIPQVSLLNSSSATTNDHKSQPLENSVLKRDNVDDVKIEPTTTTTVSTTKTESPLTPNESSSSSNITIQTREQNSPNEPLLDSNVNSSVTTKVIPKKVIRNKTMIKNSSSVVNVIRGNEDMGRSSATSSPSSPSSSPQQQKLFIPSTNRDRRKTVNFKEIEKEEIEFHPNRATLFMALPPTMTTTTTTNNQTTKQIETYDDDVPYEDEVVNDNNNNTMAPSTNESSSTTTTVLMTDHPSTKPSLYPVIEQQELSSDEEDDSILNSLLNEESEISTTTKITPSNNTRDTSTDDEDLDKLLASYTKQRKVTLPPKSTNHTALSPVQPSKSTSLKTLPVVDVKSTQRRNSSVNRSNTNNGSKSIPVENNSRRRPSRMVTSFEDLLNEEEDDSSNE